MNPRMKWIIFSCLCLAGYVSAQYTADVVVVGAGAAGWSAALGVYREKPGASVIVLDADRLYGGTSYRSGGRLWIPNNLELQQEKWYNYTRQEDIEYMEQVAYPDQYDSTDTYLGIGRFAYDLIAKYYDAGSEIIDYYNRTYILPTEIERYKNYPNGGDPLNLSGTLAADYLTYNQEVQPRIGRTILPKAFPGSRGRPQLPVIDVNYAASLRGPDLIEWLRQEAILRGTKLLTNANVQDVTFDSIGAINGVSGVITVRTPLVPDPIFVPFTVKSKAVIFTSGGFSKNLTKLDKYFAAKPFSGGGCAVMTAQGAIVDLALKYGWSMNITDAAWLIENVWEQYRLDPTSDIIPANYYIFQAYWLNGDSMITVNAKGQRLVNEKLNYNVRTKIHWNNPSNDFLYSVFDQHTAEYFTGVSGQITFARQTFIGPYDTFEHLQAGIQSRLSSYRETSNIKLDEKFAQRLSSEVQRYNKFADQGYDADYERGIHNIDVWWHSFCLTFATPGIPNCITANTNSSNLRYPNPTMRPLTSPYYAVILSSGLQDTKGGPVADANGQIIGPDGPIKGLYGAGNAVASVAGYGYWGAGGTLGPAVVFGHIAGRNAIVNI